MKASVAAAAALFAATPAAAQAPFQHYVFPLSGVTGISRSAQSGGDPASAGSRYGGMIDARYADLFLDDVTQKQLVAQFQDNVAKAFVGSVIGPNQVSTATLGQYKFEPYSAAECKPAFRANYRDAFAIAIGVSRVSAYFNTFGASTQVLVPITYTLRFVKLNGAEVIFSGSRTIYTDLTSVTADFYKPGTTDISAANAELLKAAIVRDATQAIDLLVQEAAKSFKPKVTEVSVIAKDGDYFIFDHGSEIGFSSGDGGGALEAVDSSGKSVGLFDIVYTSDRVAIAVPSNFSPDVRRATQAISVGAKLNFEFSKPGRDDAKPTLLAVQYTAGDKAELGRQQVMDNALQSIIADDIGYRAPFNLLKHDPDFVLMKNQISAEANCASQIYEQMPGFAVGQTIRHRDPDYFLRLDSVVSPEYRISGVQGAVVKDIFETAVELSTIDRGQAIRQVFVGRSAYEAARVGDKGLSLEQAREVSLKNAAAAAMQSMIQGFKSAPRTVAIKSVNGNQLTLAEPISPSDFKTTGVVRPLRVGAKTLLLPIGVGEAKLDQPQQPTTSLTFKGKLRTGDLLALVSDSAQRKPLQICDATHQRRFLTAPLQNASGAEDLMARAVGAQLKSEVLLETDPTYLNSAKSALVGGYFDEMEFGTRPAPAACLIGMELQQLTKSDCTGNACSGEAAVSAGLRVIEGQQKVAEATSGVRYTYTGLPTTAVSPFVGVAAFKHHLDSISELAAKMP